MQVQKTNQNSNLNFGMKIKLKGNLANVKLSEKTLKQIREINSSISKLAPKEVFLDLDFLNDFNLKKLILIVILLS